MKTLFIYPNLTRQEYFPVGIACLSAILKSNGHEVDIVDYTSGGGTRKCLNKIRSFRPDLVAFSLRSGEFDFCVEVAGGVKKNFDVPIIFGGVHPTIMPEQVIKEPSVDMICVGEGDYAILELAEKMDRREDAEGIANIWTKTNGAIIRNPLSPLIDDLDALPFPDREVFDQKRFTACTGSTEVVVGRGCPFNCTYCINHILQGLYRGKGKYVRMRSVDKVLEEIGCIKERYGVKFINFNDDTFTHDKKWVKEFCDKYGAACKIPFAVNTRVENITTELCVDLKKAGCVTLSLGIESGDPKIRREVLKRRMTNDQIVRAFQICKEEGLATYAFNMVGIPYETEKEIQETIELNRKIRPDFLQVSIFQPYPGTELRRICEENGWMKKKKVPFSHKLKSIMDYPHLSSRQIERHRKFFRFNVIKEYNLRKALLTLLLDINYERFYRFRSQIPLSIKYFMYKMDRKFRSLSSS